MATENENKLIAEFMGFHKTYLGWFDNEEVLNHTEDNTFDLEDMMFHSSWDWLMPVVEKIDMMGANVLIGRMFCDINYTDPLDQSKHFEIRIVSGVKINAIIGAAVEFIEWYNSQYKD